MDLITIIKNLLLYGFLLFILVLFTSFIVERIKQKQTKINKDTKPKSNLIQRAKMISNLGAYSNEQQHLIGSYDYSIQNSKELKFLHDTNQSIQFYYRDHPQNNEIDRTRANSRQRYTIVNEIKKENSKNFKKIYLDNCS